MATLGLIAQNNFAARAGVHRQARAAAIVPRRAIHRRQQAFRLHLAQRRQQSATAARLLQLQKPDGTRHRRELTAAQVAFARAGTQFFRQAAERLQRQQTLLHAVSPDNILARGFAVVRTARGKVVRDTASLKTGQKLQLTLADGSRGIQVLPPHGQGELFE